MFNMFGVTENFVLYGYQVRVEFSFGCDVYNFITIFFFFLFSI